jgi:metal-dependent hydrolase (beta-lactamase superfamily II)
VLPGFDPAYETSRVHRIDGRLGGVARGARYLIPGHCSGERFYDVARNELGDKVIHSAVGTRFVFEA